MDMAWTWILHIKSEVLDTIQHDMLAILKYPGHSKKLLFPGTTKKKELPRPH